MHEAECKSSDVTAPDDKGEYEEVKATGVLVADYKSVVEEGKKLASDEEINRSDTPEGSGTRCDEEVVDILPATQPGEHGDPDAQTLILGKLSLEDFGQEEGPPLLALCDLPSADASEVPGCDPTLIEPSQELVPAGLEAAGSGQSEESIDRRETESFGTPEKVTGILNKLLVSDSVAHLSPPCGDTTREYLDGLILKDCPLPVYSSEHGALCLKDCLSDCFMQDMTSSEQLTPKVIVWMQQLAGATCETLWDLEKNKAINAYKEMRKASETYDATMRRGNSTLAAVHSAAQKSIADMDRRYAGKPNHDKVVESQALVLCKWVSQQHVQCRSVLETACKLHDKAAATFTAVVDALIASAHAEYLAELEVPPIDEEGLFSQLNQQMQQELAGEEGAPEQVSATEEVPECAGTDALLKVKALLNQAMASGNVHDCDALKHEMGILLGMQKPAEKVVSQQVRP